MTLFWFGILTGIAGLAMIYTAGDYEFPLWAGITLVVASLFLTGAL